MSDLRIGPLSFVSPLDVVGETLGESLEVVGAAVAAGDARPRGLKLKLPVRGDDDATDRRAAGLLLRRQVRQLMSNPAWRATGLPFLWEPDAELDGWLLIGGGDLTETDPGISFGEFELELSDVYLIGQVGTHGPGRRAIVADRRGGLASRDTKGRLYSTDFAGVSLPASPIALPNSAALTTGPTGSTAGGPSGGIWVAGIDGQVWDLRFASWEFGVSGIDRDRWFTYDESGSVRVWDTKLAIADGYFNGWLQDPDGTIIDHPDYELDPADWERIYGPVVGEELFGFTLENDAVRIVFLGHTGIALDFYDDVAGDYVRRGLLDVPTGFPQIRVIEVMPDRAVVELDGNSSLTRIILQRGWWGPRVEVYRPFGNDGDVIMYYTAVEGGETTIALDTTAFASTGVAELTHTGFTLNAACGQASDSVTVDPVRAWGWNPPDDPQSIKFRAAGLDSGAVLVVQFAPDDRLSGTDLAGRALVDARTVPLVVGR